MKRIYLCMSSDIVHNGHIKIISKAAELGKVTVGVLTDEAIAKYKRFPLINFDERYAVISAIKGVNSVVEQRDVDYTENLLKYKPDIVVHGDDWRVGIQQGIRKKVIETLKTYGGELVEFPYTYSEAIERLEQDSRRILSMPELRRCRLNELLRLKPVINILEAHNGLTGLIVENTVAMRNGHPVQFDGMWVSSLCDSTAKGKPDTELVDNTSRLNTIDEIMEVTTKPIILDGDSGGSLEHFPFWVKTLERIGVSAVIIEDKVGAKRNSLFGTEVHQTQATIQDFSRKIEAGRKALTTPDFRIIARIESLILEQGMEDAITRARAFLEAGANGIMIHSRQKSPDEIFEFCRQFRSFEKNAPLVVVPTTFNNVTQEEWAEHGVNIVIHANHLVRSAFPAMQNTAVSILENGNSEQASKRYCMPIKQVLTLIPEQ